MCGAVEKMLRRLTLCVQICAAVLGAVLLVPSCSLTAAEVVEFDSAAFTYAPSPFKVRQAKKEGITLEPMIEPSVRLVGFLAKPKGAGPFPAVVLMHGCAGITKWNKVWTDRLVAWGFVVLDMDSFTPRGLRYICDGREISTATPWTRALDAYGAKDYLSTLRFIDATRIAVMGMSHGGAAVLHTIERSTSAGLQTNPFQAAIALYPLCRKLQHVHIPTLILIGDKDTWTLASWCKRHLDELQPPHEVTLKVFPGAHHIFDLKGVDEEQLGHTNRYHPQAGPEAIEIIRKFLKERLSRMQSKLLEHDRFRWNHLKRESSSIILKSIRFFWF